MNRQILIIDNNENFLTLIEPALTSKGFKVKSFLAVDNIFNTIKECEPDLILMDYLLWGTTGGELCSQIKHNPFTLQIPVILISAYPKLLLTKGACGCDEFIEKPFNMEQLTERINYHLKIVGHREKL